ncbi:unnamed protein product, partial [Iphiclides podalirius]
MSRAPQIKPRRSVPCPLRVFKSPPTSSSPVTLGIVTCLSNKASTFCLLPVRRVLNSPPTSPSPITL